MDLQQTAFICVMCIFVFGARSQDTCEVNCIWIADGALPGSKCNWLLDPSTEVYQNRKWYCSKGFAKDCKSTCEIIMNDPDATMKPTPAPKPTSPAAPLDPTCVDGVLGVHIMDGGYRCKYLTKQYQEDANIGIYVSRKSICANSMTDCCASCRIVAEETACQDNTLGVHIMDVAYSCKYLTKQYEEDTIIGIYGARRSLCADSITDCCESCKIVASEPVCEDDPLGVHIMDGDYSCNLLTQFNEANQHLGIYSSRQNICKNPLTNCCASCKVVAEEVCEDEVLGIQMLGGAYSCKYLTQIYPEDEPRGIYVSRKSFCADPLTKCCASCKLVASEEPEVTSAPAPSTDRPTTNTITKKPAPTPAPLTDTCETGCLWVGDGALAGSRCNWLLDPSKDIFPNRVRLCQGGLASGCRKTCHTVLTNPDVTLAPSTPLTAAPQECKDNFLRLSKMTYPCNDLHRSDSDVYSDRTLLCQRFHDQCCQTCIAVQNEKPSSEVKYTNENNVNHDDPGVIVIDDVTIAQPAPAPAQSASQFNFFQHLQRQFESFLRKQNEERNRLQQMFNTFSSLWSQMNKSR